MFVSCDERWEANTNTPPHTEIRGVALEQRTCTNTVIPLREMLVNSSLEPRRPKRSVAMKESRKDENCVGLVGLPHRREACQQVKFEMVFVCHTNIKLFGACISVEPVAPVV